MNNYKVHYDPPMQDKIISIVKNFSNDILIDKVEDDGVSITIELEDEESQILYKELIEHINEQTDPARP